MGNLILLPSQADQRKTFHAIRNPKYYTTGVARGHLPDDVVAATCLAQAKKNGCDDIVVCSDGLLPRRYTVAQVEAAVRARPWYYRSFLPPPPLTPQQAAAERQRFAHEQRTKTGLFLVER